MFLNLKSKKFRNVIKIFKIMNKKVKNLKNKQFLKHKCRSLTMKFTLMKILLKNVKNVLLIKKKHTLKK